MPEGGKTNHVALETLSAYAERRLRQEEIEAVRRHLAECALCDLELKRLERFLSLGDDRELEEEARWRDAAPRLDEAFREKVLPGAAGRTPALEDRTVKITFAAAGRKETPGAPPAPARRARPAARPLRWLVPAAAAAGFALFLFFASRAPSPQTPARRESPLRGAPAEYGVTLVAPIGELEAAPERFVWRSARANEYYSVEIFGADLKRLWLAERLADTTWAPPDTLEGLLKPRVMYLWSVKGYRGLDRPAVSPNGWFKIAPREAAPGTA